LFTIFEDKALAGHHALRKKFMREYDQEYMGLKRHIESAVRFVRGKHLIKFTSYAWQKKRNSDITKCPVRVNEGGEEDICRHHSGFENSHPLRGATSEEGGCGRQLEGLEIP
jgi:hypothetical protein